MAARIGEQVSHLLAKGLRQRAIAGRLGLSERTVAGHIARLRELLRRGDAVPTGPADAGSPDGGVR
ncbi:LuxR C-terminal-related transcriptional regulator [Kitasatospora aureofaciens]|uniref:LuxR C-terminal-related transcriptional regulator n=1 Tax=Kitasatospora aureofaciens TaxID=1894 RepID=UPI0027E07FAF|nr:LuxR C-terminal-related transcriptional regulator [Kitasatospora aureofaciens]